MDANPLTLTIPSTVAIYALLHLGVPWLRARMTKRDRFGDVTPIDLPKRSDQSDQKFRALALDSFERTKSLHEALGKKSDTGGYVILEMFKSLAANMTEQTKILAEQTTLLRQIAGQPKSDTRYRGSG